MAEPKYCWQEFISDIHKVPNWFTFSRIIGFFFLLFPLLWHDKFIAAFAVFLLLEATDFIDGEWAHRKKMVTWLGKGLDPFADKVLLIGTMFVLGIFRMYPVPGLLLVSFEILLLIMGVMAFLNKNRSINLNANLFGKTKSILEAVAVSFMFLHRSGIFLVPDELTLSILWAAIFAATLSIFGHLGLLG